jgi:hypothetical protein
MATGFSGLGAVFRKVEPKPTADADEASGDDKGPQPEPFGFQLRASSAGTSIWF